jgi:PHP family Zn ribbon phosphoesterase
MLIEKIGDEFTVLMDASKEELCKIVDPKVAETIILVREEKIQITPGYDGVYGQLIIPDEKDVNRIQIQKVGQQNITEFM